MIQMVLQAKHLHEREYQSWRPCPSMIVVGTSCERIICAPIYHFCKGGREC